MDAQSLPTRLKTAEALPMAGMRAVFVGTARNCGWFLPGVFQNIQRLATLYADTAVVIVENDSIDDSKYLIRSWMADRPNAKLLELDGLAATEELRTKRIATARNAALQYIRSSPFSNWDQLIVMDFDEVNVLPISLESFSQAMQFIDRDAQTAGVFANQTIGYYDIWALRKEGWCAADCWKQVARRPKLLNLAVAKVLYVFARQVAIPVHAAPIAVRSAFGGLAIYKLSSAAPGNYIGMDADGMEVCEHVSFNTQISEGGGKLFIYPSLTNEAPGSHLVNPRDVGRLGMLLLFLSRLWTTIFPPWR